MDPLTALSLAGNVIQFVDFGSKLLSQGFELYRSTRGHLLMDEELELITSDLTGLIVKMRIADVTRGEHPGSPSFRGKTLHHVPRTTFQKICDEATKIAQAILAKLNTIKIDDSQNRKLESFKHVWKRLWSKSELDELLGRLSRLQDLINTQALTSILQNTSELNVQTLARFDSIDRQTQQILVSLLASNQAGTCEIMTAIAQLMGRLESFISAEYIEHQHIREAIIQRRKIDPTLDPIGDIIVGVEMHAVSEKQETWLRANVQRQILEKLSYSAMPKRYESVVEAHPLTFEWAFQDSAQGGPPGDNLATWLRSDNGLYWITGKPGSGKSTLMKHIFDDSRTRLYLDEWAQKGKRGPLVIVTFFFWNSGTLEQKSQRGMLRSLLFQVLEQVPALLPAIFPSLWSRQYGKWVADGTCVWCETWTLRILLDAFKRLIAQKVMPIKLFFLIDGLDEFEGDHEVLAELFNETVCASSKGGNDYVKVCLSSRPWVVFKENFAGCSMLELQKLTYNDIERFVTETFWANSAFKGLAEREPEAVSQLISEIVGKAEGVFLWVRIVVKELLRGFRNRDSIPDLWGRLQALPKDLEPLYRQIMSQIDPAYVVWASKAFQVLRAVREVVVPKCFNIEEDASEQGTLSVAELYLALHESLSDVAVNRISHESLDDLCEQTEFHINARCACLLEVIKDKNKLKVTSSSLVQYLHRTARDFLEHPIRWMELLEHTKKISFDPYRPMMRCQSLVLHRLIQDDSVYLSTQRKSLRTISLQILAFASRADALGLFHSQETAIVDNVKENTERLRVYLEDGMSFKKPKIPHNLKSSIMTCALVLNMSEYISVQLLHLRDREDNKAAAMACTEMLYSQMRAKNVIEGAPPMNLKMATVLIGNGANINHKSPARLSEWGRTRFLHGDNFSTEQSSWGAFLNHGLEIMASLEGPDRYPDFARMMDLFLRFGADPHVRFYTGGPFSLIQFFETYVRPNYLDVDDLQDRIFQLTLQEDDDRINAGIRNGAGFWKTSSALMNQPVIGAASKSENKRKLRWWGRSSKSPA